MYYNENKRVIHGNADGTLPDIDLRYNRETDDSVKIILDLDEQYYLDGSRIDCLLYTSPSPRD